VDHVPDPLPLRKSGSAENQVSKQEAMVFSTYNGSEMFLRNMSSILTNYKAFLPRRQGFFIVSAVRISNPK
jgi:hypothetical protein